PGGERLSDLFGGLFGSRGRGGATTRSRRGADVETEATLTFREAAEGVTRSFQLASEAPCPTCRGTGAKAGTSPRMCPRCTGTGREAARWVAVRWPGRGVEAGGRGGSAATPCPPSAAGGRGRVPLMTLTPTPGVVTAGRTFAFRGKADPGVNVGQTGACMS